MNPNQMNLIGVEVMIIQARNKTLEGLKGVVTDETKNTITIQERKILKKGVKLKINTPQGEVIIDGDDLIGRPEERLKKKPKVKSRW